MYASVWIWLSRNINHIQTFNTTHPTQTRSWQLHWNSDYHCFFRGKLWLLVFLSKMTLQLWTSNYRLVWKNKEQPGCRLMHLNAQHWLKKREIASPKKIWVNHGGGAVSAVVRDHAAMRLRRYSNTASVPLAMMAALGVRKGFPSRLRHLRDNTGCFFFWACGIFTQILQLLIFLIQFSAVF